MTCPSFPFASADTGCSCLLFLGLQIVYVSLLEGGNLRLWSHDNTAAVNMTQYVSHSLDAVTPVSGLDRSYRRLRLIFNTENHFDKVKVID